MLKRRRRERRLLDIEDDSYKVVSEERFASEVERKGRVYEDANTPGKRRKLWDTIIGRWTSSLPVDQILMDMQKIIARCTGADCIYTSLDIGGKRGLVEKHITETQKSGTAHQQATIKDIEREGEVIPYCSVCRKQFRARPWRADEHIQQVIDDAHGHKDAKKITVIRFTEGPPVSVIAVPVASQEEQSQEPRLRKRRRRRNRGNRGNGH